MEATIKSCIACDAHLYSVVKHCPYCGAAVGGARPAAPPVNIEATSAPVQVKAPAAASAPTEPDAAGGRAVHRGDENGPVSSAGKGDGPPDLEELWGDFNRKLTGVFGPKGSAPRNGGSAKPKPVAQPSATVVTPTTTPTSTSTSTSTAMQHDFAHTPTEPVPGSKKPGFKAGVLLAIVLAVPVVLAGFYLVGKPSKKEDACDRALSQAAATLAGGDAAGARSQTVLAMASCSGEARVKAGELQSAIDKTIAAQATCERSFRRIGSQLAEHRLQSARSTLDQLDTACNNSVRGKALREQIVAGQAAATAAETEMRKYLVEGDLKAARAALDQISANNREHPDLAALRQELAAGLKALDVAPLTAPTATLRPPTATPPSIPTQAASPRPILPPAAAPPAPNPQPIPPAVAAPPTPNPQVEMAHSFLRDAEVAMNQLKFDAAKTYVESARRIDPGNTQAAALARRIKERELQYLKDETSIK